MPSTKHNATVSEPAVWVYRPWLDLIVGCGAWSLPLMGLAYFSSAASTLTWSVLFYFLALFLNYPHYMATIYRAYHTEEDFRKYRIFTVHITLLVVLTAIFTHFWVGVLPWIFTLYLTASPWHYSGQNYGLFIMFARRAGTQPSLSQRRCIYAAFLISYAILFLNFHTGPSADPLFVSLNIPSRISAWAQAVLAIAFVGCSSFGLVRLVYQGTVRKLIPSLTLFSTQCVWFLLPTLLSLIERYRVPQSRYSTGVLALMHSAQYLWITSYYAKREATSTGGRTWRPLAYFSLLITGGIALFIPGPWISSLIFHFDFTRSFLIFTALVNIHHFILDGAIWKLRDGRIAALLVSSRAQIARAATESMTRTTSALRWLAGSDSIARKVRTAAALALLAWGGLDQLHYYFALQDGNLVALKRAALLTPYDTPVETRLAHAALEDGKPEESVTAWEYAIAANPADPAPREAFLQYLTHQRQFEQAYLLSGNWLKLAPRDTALLINHGILAQQFGHIDEAERNWQKALVVDPSQTVVDLYLAAALDRQGNFDGAIQHYESFLVKIAHQPVSDRPPSASLISIILKLADCEKRTSHPDQALQFYGMAQTLAAQTHEAKLESFSLVGQASLEAALGQTDHSLHHYQEAIQLDDKLNDSNIAATDWYMFALFLRKARFPSGLVYASLIKSQSLLPADASGRSAASQTAKELEKELGSKSVTIRRNPDPLLREALELSSRVSQP
ncbi:MAG TPA: tetratricopeptide repeat protein [Terriglobales bacterium]|nr:tetratricopeptide repeat protein [Terriglobales bacterium]